MPETEIDMDWLEHFDDAATIIRAQIQRDVQLLSNRENIGAFLQDTNLGYEMEEKVDSLRRALGVLQQQIANLQELCRTADRVCDPALILEVR